MKLYDLAAIIQKNRTRYYNKLSCKDLSVIHLILFLEYLSIGSSKDVEMVIFASVLFDIITYYSTYLTYIYLNIYMGLAFSSL